MATNDRFKAAIAAKIEKTQRKLDDMAGHLAFEILRKLVLRSPVDTGRFRASWTISTNSPSDQAASAMANTYPKAAVNAAMTAMASFRTGETIYITNSLPYARKLEYGWSKQAPAGMVRVTVLELPDILKGAVKALD